MRRIRYIKAFLVIGAVAMLGLCALIVFTQINRPTPSAGARLIFNSVEVGKDAY